MIQAVKGLGCDRFLHVSSWGDAVKAVQGTQFCSAAWMGGRTVPPMVGAIKSDMGKLESIVVSVSCCCRKSNAAASLSCCSADTNGVGVQVAAVV